MSGTKKSREHLKSRFLKYMFPTEEDFANVFESYVHKDDTIDPDKVKVDDKTISEILDGKSDDGHKHEIADVNGLESALNAISQILGKQESETIVQLAQRFASLTGKYTNVYTFVTKVKEFLEDADAADETINRWHEIESFLQGITDTETLLGLLQEMKQEILQSIPQPQQGNYLELVADLDAYTDAPDGTIVKYTGPTNNKYTHGWDYEKVGGEPQGQPITFPAGTITLTPTTTGSDSADYAAFLAAHPGPFYLQSCEYWVRATDDGCFDSHVPDPPHVGDLAICNEYMDDPHFDTVSAVPSDNSVEIEGYEDQFGNKELTLTDFETTKVSTFIAADRSRILIEIDAEDSDVRNDSYMHPLFDPDNLLVYGSTTSHKANYTFGTTSESVTIAPASAPASWQPSKSMPVID